MLEYKEDDRPCLVGKKPCGCYVAALALDEEVMEDSTAISNFIEEARAYDGIIEARPVRFVREGGLTFDCRHKQHS